MNLGTVYGHCYPETLVKADTTLESIDFYSVSPAGHASLELALFIHHPEQLHQLQEAVEALQACLGEQGWFFNADGVWEKAES